MATIDLGKIKQVFRGTYNNATAYTVDDLVSFTDTVGGLQNTSTYIAVANTTGNAPASGGTIHASWNLVAQGVPDRLPSQSGNANKFLKTDGSALSFDNAGGMIKLASASLTSQNLSNISLDYFTTTYRAYKFIFDGLYYSTSTYPKIRMKKNSDDAIQTGSQYAWFSSHPYMQTGGTKTSNVHGTVTTNQWNIHGDNNLNTNWSNGGEITFFNPMAGATRKAAATWITYGEEGDRSQGNIHIGYGQALQAENYKGFQLFPNGGAISAINYTLYGLLI